MAWAFTVAMVGSCHFLSIETSQSIELFGVGFFNYEDDGKCKRIEEDIDEAGLKAGRLFAVLQSLIVSAVLVLLMLLHTVVLPKLYQQRLCTTIRALLYSSIWCQLFSFFIFEVSSCKSENSVIDCTLGGAGVVAILNVFLLIGVSALSFFVQLNPKPFLQSSQQDEQEKPGEGKTPIALVDARETHNPQVDSTDESKDRIPEDP